MNQPSPTPSCSRRAPRREERGFTLAAVIVMMTILMIFLAFTIPTMWSDVMQRERERQTIWVIKQYARAIKGYMDARKVYPTKLEDLEEQNKPRVLRALYPNPLSGEMDWVLIPFGTPTGGQAGGPTGGTGLGPPETATAPPAAAQGGPFIGVRPPQSGQSMLSFRGEESYDQWIYTVTELDQEIAQSLGGAPPPAAPPTGGPGGPGR